VRGEILLIERIKLKPSYVTKSRAVPLHAMEALEGGGRYNPYSFLTSALDEGEWSASRLGRAVPPVPIGQGAGLVSEPVWTQRLEEKSSTSLGDRTPVVQFVVSHCTD
jgi:hypothetical protein